MGCATCGKGGVRSRSAMGARAILRNRIVPRYVRKAMNNTSDPTVTNVVPTAEGTVIPPNAMSENPASGVIPPQELNIKPVEFEVAGENETAAEEASEGKGE